jgi:predicted transcriptional regulator
MSTNVIHFNSLSRLGLMFAKSYAPDLLKLLVIYRNISASEAASRLNLHIKTAQDFLETLHQEGVVTRKEARDRRRPYYRYILASKELIFKIDLDDLVNHQERTRLMEWRIREKKNSGAVFKTARNTNIISTVSIFSGQRRRRTERKVLLTRCQGEFLFHLPFPTQQFESVSDIIKQARISGSDIPEVLDIIHLLTKEGIIEIGLGSE